MQMQAQNSGDMRLFVCDQTNLSCTYSTSSEDGCLIINGWQEICGIYDFTEVGDKIISVIHVGHAGPVLFVHTIAKTTDDE